MRLELKLAVLALAILAPKTELYLSRQDVPGTQVVISCVVPSSSHDQDAALADHIAVDNNASKCPRKPADADNRDSLAVHADDKSLQGSHG